MAPKKGKVYRPERDEDEKETIYIPGEKDIEEAKKAEEAEWEKGLDRFKKAVDALPADTRKKMAEEFDKALEAAAMRWPSRIFEHEESNSKFMSFCGSIIGMGWGDMQACEGSQICMDAIGELDLDDCVSEFGAGKDLSSTVATCLALDIENRVKEELRNDDSLDESDIEDCYIYYNTPLDMSIECPDDDVREKANEILWQE